MPEYRRILLDGSCVQVRREGTVLVAGDGRRVAAEDAVHLPPVVPTKIVAVHLNHRLAQDGSTDEMQWDMHYLVADIARTITLYPGDVLLSGTPANSRPGPARRRGLGRGGRAGPAGQPHRRRAGGGSGGLRRPADGERGGHLHRVRRGLGVPRHPAADPGLTAR